MRISSELAIQFGWTPEPGTLGRAFRPIRDAVQDRSEFATPPSSAGPAVPTGSAHLSCPPDLPAKSRIGKAMTRSGRLFLHWPDQRKEVVHSMNSHGTLEVAGR